MIHVLKHVAATIHAWAFTVPQRKHAIVVRRANQIDLLGAPHGGRG